MTRPTRLCSTCLLIGAVFLSERASAVVVDDFSVGPLSLVHTGSPIDHMQNGLDPDHVIGGSRHITIGLGGGSMGQSVEIDTDERTFTFLSGPNLGYLGLQYGTQASPLDLDLTADGNEKLVLHFQSVNPLTAINVISVQIQFGPTLTSRTVSFSETQSLPDGSTRRIATLDQFVGVDLTDARILRLGASRFNEDFTLKGIFTVPEPASIVMVLMAIGGPLFFARRRWQGNLNR